jgi:transposase
MKITNDELMFALNQEAERKNLDMFIFEKEELKSYFPDLNPNEDFALVTLARNRDNAIYNMKNLRKTYIINDYENNYRKQQD